MLSKLQTSFVLFFQYLYIIIQENEITRPCERVSEISVLRLVVCITQAESSLFVGTSNFTFSLEKFHAEMLHLKTSTQYGKSVICVFYMSPNEPFLDAMF